jgi:hypothetical protein
MPLGLGPTAVHSVVGYDAVDEAGGLQRTVVPLLDLCWGGPDGGLRVGWTDARLHLEAGPAAASPKAEGLRWVPPLGLRWRGADGIERRLGWFLARPRSPAPEDVYALSGFQAGLELAWSAREQGLRLGFVAYTSTIVPCGRDGTWTFHYESRRPEAARLAPFGLDP